MSRSFLRRLAPPTRLTAATILLAVGLTACATDEPGTDEPGTDGSDTAAASPADDTADPDVGGAEVAADEATFPVTVTDDAGEVTVEDQPEAIVSLSPTATEMLFAIGAGDRVVAVDEFSNFPPEAPTTDLSGFTPSTEAILEHSPDLVVIQNDANDLVAGLAEAGVPVLQLGAAADLVDAFDQFEALGAATGTDAEAVVTDIRTRLDELSSEVSVETDLTYYHELSPDLYTATSATFIGDVYGLYGLENIADAADSDATGYPQLSSEHLVEQDPDHVFLACTVLCDVTAESFCARPALGDLTACAEGNVTELDDDVASRWGPRVVDFAETVGDALQGG